MRSILVVNPKGGCGKTTLATQLASYFAAQQKKVLLIDRDPQKSSCDWLSARPAACSKIESLSLSAEAPVPETWLDSDYIINDMPAGWHPTLTSSALSKTEKNFLLIPVLPSPTDIKASLRFIMSIYRSGVLENNEGAPPVKAGFVANRTRAQQRYYNILIEFLRRVEIPLIATLRDSQNYIRAMEHGISIFDLPATSVRQDLEQWWPLIEWVSEAN